MEVTASRIRRPLLEAPDTILLGVASRPPLPAFAAPGDVHSADDLPARETSAWLPSSEWTWRLDGAHPIVRDAALEVAVMVQLAWMKEVHLLERDAPPLARVDSPEPPFRFIAFR